MAIKNRLSGYRVLCVLAILLTLVLVFPCKSSFAQHSDSLTDKKKLRAFIIASGVAYGGTLIGLNQLWYKNADHQSFRFFNDNAEWKQVDKAGHFYSSFYFSYGVSRALTWCKVPATKSMVAGALSGFLILLPIEIFDGFSDAYGASGGDLIANAAGASFFLGQQLLWQEVRIIPKFSFHHTHHAGLRSEVLGDNSLSEIFKNYNGQTYWLSADMDKFIRFPRWLNLSVGYGAHEMIHARDNQNLLAGYDSYRQFYFSLDFDLTAVHSRSKVIKTLLFLANTIKIPAPALELSRNRIAFHPLYF